MNIGRLAKYCSCWPGFSPSVLKVLPKFSAANNFSFVLLLNSWGGMPSLRVLNDSIASPSCINCSLISWLDITWSKFLTKPFSISLTPPFLEGTFWFQLDLSLPFIPKASLNSTSLMFCFLICSKDTMLSKTNMLTFFNFFVIYRMWIIWWWYYLEV